jgi:ATP-binding cassette subfamily B protein
MLNMDNYKIKDRIFDRISSNIKKISMIFSIVYKCSPLYTLIILAVRLMDALVSLFQVLVVGAFINDILIVFNAEKGSSILYLPLLGVILIVSFQLLNGKVLYFIQVKLQNKLRIDFSLELQKRNAKILYKYTEHPDTQDLISRILNDSEIKLLDFFNNVVNLICLIISLVGVCCIISPYMWWGGLLILVVFMPLCIISLKSGKANYEAQRDISKYNRRYMYLGEVLTSRDSIEERTLFNYSETINQKWRCNFEKARKIIFNIELKWFIRVKLGGVVMAVLLFVIMIFLVPQVLNGVLSVGIFTSLANAIFKLIYRMEGELTYLLDNFAKCVEYVDDLNNFYKLETNEEELDKPSKEIIGFESLEFKNVSFKYPNTEKYILNDMSFKIDKGKHYAFVGINGAGKTTVSKLIAGLYDEFVGDILINGKSIKSYKRSQIKALCSIAFQDFTKYSITLKENLMIGNINEIDNCVEQIESVTKVMELDKIIDQLPSKIDTNLGKASELSVDLSGGQWQNVVLGRFIMNKGKLRILDEPTSALDPISESRLYEKFEQLSKGQTTIFISHRLGATKLADEIMVIESGKVAENGTHDELIKKRKIYYELFESQRSWYI